MKKKFFILFFLIQTTKLIVAAPNTQELVKGVLEFTNNTTTKKNYVKLNGEWEVYYNLLLAPSEINNYSDSVKYVFLPDKWPHKNNINYATYRAIIIAPNNTNQKIFLVNTIRTASKIWINNKLCYEMGNVADNANEHIPGLLSFDNFLSLNVQNSTNDTIEIVIQVSNFTTYKSAGIIGNIYFGEAKDLIKKKNNSFYIGFIAIGVFLIIGIYHLIIYFFNKKEKSTLFLGLTSLSIIVRTMFNHQILEYFISNFRTFWVINLLGVIVYSWLLTLFFFNLYKKEFGQIPILIISILSMIFIGYSFLPILFSDRFYYLIFLFLGTTSFYILLYVIPKVLKNKNFTAIWSGLGILAITLSIITDYAHMSSALQIEYLSSYGFIIFIILQSIYLAKENAKTNNNNNTLTLALQKYNKNLSSIVDEKTEEIEMQKTQLLNSNEELKILSENLKAQREEYKVSGEEFGLMAKQLWEANVELEKLSIVASHTNNAVIIFDSDFNLEWSNDAFYRNHNLQTDKELDLIKLTDFADIKTIINMINHKKSISFELLTNENPLFWVQFSITPIFEENDLRKIVAIETDISKLKEAEDKISEQNNAMKSSIKYAKRIQNSILPLISEIKKHLNIFILYKPKDIVSGDFYWFSPSPANKEVYFIAVSDCTGHGVPGAFMSMIGSTLLNEIVKQKRIFSPKDILTELKNNIVVLLRQNSVDNIDGMDVAFCKINTKKKEVVFSGAKRPLYYFDFENNEIKKFKGDLVQIGGSFGNCKKSSTNITLSVNNNDRIYLTSDGYIDQNNYERKKIGTANFLKIIKESTTLSLPKQKETLENYLINWQKNEPQRDDITILGIKF